MDQGIGDRGQAGGIRVLELSPVRAAQVKTTQVLTIVKGQDLSLGGASQGFFLESLAQKVFMEPLENIPPSFHPKTGLFDQKAGCGFFKDGKIIEFGGFSAQKDR